MNSSNIAIDVTKCLACGNCVDRCIMDNLRLVLPPCRQASPLGVNYQSVIRLIAEGKPEAAARELRRSTPFGGLLAAWGDAAAARACSRSHSGGALNMAGLFAWLVETQEAVVYSVPSRLPRSRKRAAVIGSGPAGLQAAFDLRLGGHAVTVYEAAAEAGVSLLQAPAQESSSAAPEALAPITPAVLEKTLDMLKAMGIVFETSAPKGQAELDQLCAEYDAVICACGKAAVLPADACGWVKGNLFAAGACVKNQKAPTALQAMASGARAAHGARNLMEGFDIDYEGNERVARGLERFQGLSDEQENAPVMEPVVPASVLYTAEEALAEASRCLGCGRPVERNMTCWYCLPCEVVCPTQALHVRIPYLIR